MNQTESPLPEQKTESLFPEQEPEAAKAIYDKNSHNDYNGLITTAYPSIDIISSIRYATSGPNMTTLLSELDKNFTIECYRTFDNVSVDYGNGQLLI